MPSNDLSKARLELANFPQEVFDQWITPFVLAYGWPFKTGAQRSIKTAWVKVFWRKDVSHWRDLQWMRITVPMGVIALDPRSQDLAQAIIGHVNGALTFEGMPPEFINRRFSSAHRFVSEHKRLPKPIVAVVQYDSTWRIADGHHRLAAAILVNQQEIVQIDIWPGLRFRLRPRISRG